MPVTDTAALIDNRVAALARFHEDAHLPRAELDVSGGIDSATMLHLVSRAIGPEQVTAVYTGIASSEDSRARARASAKSCGVPLVELEMTDISQDLLAKMITALSNAGYDRSSVERHIEQDPTVLGSFRSCLRAPVGRGINRMTGGGLRHGTGNECEDRFLRFYQKGGDGEVDSNPIAMLSKGEVFQLARALDVPRAILEAVPSPDLHGIGEAHNDEDELAALYGVRWTYSKVDPDTGKYTFAGSIERMSRLLDEGAVEDAVFGEDPLDDAKLAKIVERGLARAFRGFDYDEVHDLILSARGVERITRHKQNPNCPTLGDRGDLLAASLLTNELPEV